MHWCADLSILEEVHIMISDQLSVVLAISDQSTFALGVSQGGVTDRTTD